MHIARLLVAFSTGFGLLYLVLIEVRGFLAARQIPKTYFDYFGKENQELSLFVMNVFLHLIPESLLFCGALILLARVLKGNVLSTTLSIALGAILSYVFWITFYFVVSQADDSNSVGIPWAQLPRQFLVPWWAVPNLLSPWPGLGVGFWLALRNHHRRALSEV